MSKSAVPDKEQLLGEFKIHMDELEMSTETVKSYFGNISRYLKWYHESFGLPPGILYRANIKDFKSYLQNIKRLVPSTVNYYLSALMKFNEFLIKMGYQTEMAVVKSDFIKIQPSSANPWDGEEEQVYTFLQKVLSSESSFSVRDHALFTLIAYTGVRNSEAISIQDADVDLFGKEILIRSGKGDKARTIIINSKAANAIAEYRKMRPDNCSPYLFLNRTGDKLTRGRINQICNQYSDFITPHKLRHFYCTQSQAKAGYSLAETATQVGHKTTRTTMRYTHPSKAQLKQKADLL